MTEKFKSHQNTYYKFGDHRFRTADCFLEYFEYYEPNEPFYFSYPVIVDYYQKIIDDFNSKMKNVQYEVVSKKKAYIRPVTNYYGNVFYEYYRRNKGLKDQIIVEQPVFTLNFIGDYSEKSKKYLQYLFHHYLRMASLTEVSFVKPDDKCEDGNYMEFICRMSNRSPGTRSLSEKQIHEADILNLDDVDRVNKITNLILELDYGDPRQTNIIHFYGTKKETIEEIENMIKEIQEKSFDKGEFYRGLGNVHHYTGSTMELCFIRTREINDRGPDVVSLYSLRNSRTFAGALFAGVRGDTIEKVENPVLTEEEKQTISSISLSDNRSKIISLLGG